MEYILILAFFSVGTASQAILFPTKAACETAKEMAIAAFPSVNAFGKKLGDRAQGVCVPYREATNG